MLILRESNCRDWRYSGLSENSSSLRQDIYYPDGRCFLDARSLDWDSTPCGKKSPAS
jgi:hypothetical protein